MVVARAVAQRDIAQALRWYEDRPRGLEVGEQLSHGGSCSVVLPATTADGVSAILKLSVPHEDARGEAAALRLWNGRGAARLLRCMPDGFTLLLERCIPGHDLWNLPIHKQIDVVAELLPQLWLSTDKNAGVRDLRDTVADLGAHMAGMRNTCAELGEVNARASTWARELRGGSERRLLHGDLNPGNILADEGHGWLAIDPKPWAGDPAFDLAQLLLNWIDADDPTGSTSLETIAAGAELLAHRLSLMPERILRWAVIKAIGWNGPGGHLLALDAAARRI